MKKKPTTLVGWQKIYPDAIRFAAETNTFLSDRAIIETLYGEGAKAKVLMDTSSGTPKWSVSDLLSHWEPKTCTRYITMPVMRWCVFDCGYYGA